MTSNEFLSGMMKLFQNWLWWWLHMSENILAKISWFTWVNLMKCELYLIKVLFKSLWESGLQDGFVNSSASLRRFLETLLGLKAQAHRHCSPRWPLWDCSSSVWVQLCLSSDPRRLISREQIKPEPQVLGEFLDSASAEISLAFDLSSWSLTFFVQKMNQCL